MLSSFTFCLLPQKMITRSGFWSAKRCLIIAVLSFSLQIKRLCRMFSAGFDMAMETSSGLCIILWANSRILAGIVAEKRIVCRCLGRCFTIFRMSSEKPISSIRSASSSTKWVVRLKSKVPRSKWVNRRPGVAITMSAPRFKLLRSCS